MLSVSIRNKNLITTLVAIGLLVAEFNASLAASIPSWFGMLVYNDLTSRVTRYVSGVIFSVLLILYMKSVVSFIYDGNACACGWS